MSKRKKTITKTSGSKAERPPILSGREAIAALTDKKGGHVEMKPIPDVADKQSVPQAKKKMSVLDAAAQVLAAAEMPLNTKMIVERMITQGLWTTSGKTPAATLYSALIREITAKAKNSRFRKFSSWKFAINDSRRTTDI